MKNNDQINDQNQELINTNTNTKGENTMNTITLKNRDEFIEKLTDIIVQNEFGRYPEDIDIYLYHDGEGNWTLKEFENPGGNSYIPDDHFTIWTIKEGTNYDYYFSGIENEIGETIPEEDKIDHITGEYHEYFDKNLDDIFSDRMIDVEWID